jgi:hypothetical protein
VKNEELRLLLEITFDRIDHAYWIRQALSRGYGRGAPELVRAREVRDGALKKIKIIERAYNRYPEARLYALRCTPTSYAFGTLWPAGTLHFWEREEERGRIGRWAPPIYFYPLYRNIWNPFAILFDLPSPRCWF